ncbi:MAG: hypothetical protein GC136_10355 [Alphaproteobacteria bacterium]|nr:hypothetical protein [Alphaproteobacteria bacterium]
MAVQGGEPTNPKTTQDILVEFLAKITEQRDNGYVFEYCPSRNRTSEADLQYVHPVRLIAMTEEAIEATQRKFESPNEESRRMRDRERLLNAITSNSYTAICPRKRLLELHHNIGTEEAKRTAKSGKLRKQFDQARTNTMRGQTYALLQMLPAATEPEVGCGVDFAR